MIFWAEREVALDYQIRKKEPKMGSELLHARLVKSGPGLVRLLQCHADARGARVAAPSSSAHTVQLTCGWL